MAILQFKAVEWESKGPRVGVKFRVAGRPGVGDLHSALRRYTGSMLASRHFAGSGPSGGTESGLLNELLHFFPDGTRRFERKERPAIIVESDLKLL